MSDSGKNLTGALATRPPTSDPPAEAPAAGSAPVGTEGTTLAPSARHLWMRSRGLLLALFVLLLSGLAYAVIRTGQHHDQLDPRSADRAGSRALAQLLAEQHITVKVATTAASAADRAGPDTTLLIANPNLLTPSQLRVLSRTAHRGPGRTVLIAPNPDVLAVFAPAATVAGRADVHNRDPGCDLAAARQAGSVELGGALYDSPVTATHYCYPANGHSSLLRLPRTTGFGDTVILGAPDLLFNQHLDKQGNASLAVQLLSEHHTVVWYLPSLDDASIAPTERRGFLDLLPPGWRWGAIQLAVAAGITALWRGRRLGPIVPEPLPVVVRAAEATEGRARLYRKANARDRAALALRQATRARLAPLVGVAPGGAQQADALTLAVAERTGVAAAQVRSLLYGTAPADDAALLRLAQELDQLDASLNDWQVRSL